MSKTFNILVTGCGGDIGQSIGKILSKSDFTKNLFGRDISHKTAAQFIYPNFSVGLLCSHPDYLNNLVNFINKHLIDIVIPIAEPELRFFSKNNIFNNIGNAKLITASPSALEIGFDKLKTAEFLKREELPYPETFSAHEINDIDAFPVILKSKTGSGSKDIHVLKSMEEFLFYTRLGAGNYIIQEHITDKDGEFTCGLYRSKKGEIRSQIFKRELTGGYSGYGEVVENDRISELLKKIAIKLHLIGSINIQLRISENTPKVFEINPRFSSTVLFRHLFGFEDLIWSIEDAVGQPLSKYEKPTVGREFYKGFNEYIN